MVTIMHLVSPTASVHIQREHPGGRVLHADAVERPSHLLREQRGGRFVTVEFNCSEIKTLFYFLWSE